MYDLPDLPIKHGDFHSYMSLPVATISDTWEWRMQPAEEVFCHWLCASTATSKWSSLDMRGAFRLIANCNVRLINHVRFAEICGKGQFTSKYLMDLWS